MNQINKTDLIGLSAIDTIKHIFLTNKPINHSHEPNARLKQRHLLMAIFAREVVRSLTDRGMELYILLVPFAVVLMI